MWCCRKLLNTITANLAWESDYNVMATNCPRITSASHSCLLTGIPSLWVDAVWFTETPFFFQVIKSPFLFLGDLSFICVAKLISYFTYKLGQQQNLDQYQ